MVAFCSSNRTTALVEVVVVGSNGGSGSSRSHTRSTTTALATQHLLGNLERINFEHKDLC